MPANNTLERTCVHRGRAALAIDCVLAGAEQAPCSAARHHKVSMPYSLIAGLVLTVASLASAAQDVVRVKFIPAYPMPDQSMEALDLEIKRLAPGTRGREVQIDRYFAAVIKILDDEKITSSWERSVIHAPFVRVEVAVAGRTITLGVSYSSNGLDSFPGPDDTNERHRRALDGILKLTIARVADRWPSK